MFTIQEATRFYDRFGSKQDSQAFCEDETIELMLKKSELQNASFVFEFGCGTGRMAETMLTHHLASSARYSEVDVRSTMISLADHSYPGCVPALLAGVAQPELKNFCRTKDGI